MNDVPEMPRGLGLAIIVCVLSALGIVIATIAGADKQSWGAALVVGMGGIVGGIILAILGLRSVSIAETLPAYFAGWAGVVLSAVGFFMSLVLLQE